MSEAPDTPETEVETPEVEVETPETPEVDAEPVETAAEEPEQPKRTPWYNKRIDKLSAEKSAAAEEAERLRKDNEAAQRRIAAYEALYGKPEDGETPQPQTTPGLYTEEDVQKRAAAIAQFNTLQQKVESTFKAGQAEHKDWQTRITSAAQAFGPDLANRVDFFEAVSDLPNGAAVYHTLAGDLNRMDEVLSMSPAKMGIALATLSADLAKKPGKRLSSTPDPIEPIETNGGPGADADLTKVSMNDYVKMREKQREERLASRR
jgi:hypothetical protein